MTAEERLMALGYDLVDLVNPPTHHSKRMHGLSQHVIPFRTAHGLLFTASIPILGSEPYYKGTIGDNLTVEEGYAAARIAAVSALLGIRYAVKDLDRVRSIIRVFCFIICTPSFRGLDRVAKGALDVFTQVLGPRGLHINMPLGMTGISGGHSIELVTVTQIPETRAEVDHDATYFALGDELVTSGAADLQKDGLAYRQTDDLLFVRARSGGDPRLRGKLGQDLTVEQGQQAARRAAINALATARDAVGSLNRVEVVQLTGFVASAARFTDQPKVLDGASGLFEQVLASSGQHTRAAIGCVSLVDDLPVEILVTFKRKNY